MPTFQIHITGIVQGVGFRPHVYRMAGLEGIKGWVSNGSQGVLICFNHVDEAGARKWLDRLIEEAPILSKIQEASLTQVSDESFSDFTIAESISEGQANVPLTPDFALCEDCKREINTRADRRFNYAFITCTNCGPRYSITQQVPYDRPVTTMESFEMCPSCQSEYNDPTNRRHYSQTNSCPTCGIQLHLYDTQEKAFLPIHREKAKIDFAVNALQNGQIIAVKGIGGYLLMCDATDDVAVELLRQRKHRPHKPLAVLYPGIAEVEEDYHLTVKERQALQNPEAPIVLLRPKGPLRLSQRIAPELQTVGVMLPYAPLLYLISKKTNMPLVATSGNISGSPIIYTDEEAIEELSSIADWIVTHDREILIPQDDSVVRFTPRHDQRIILRRSRGMAPNYFGKHLEMKSLEGCLAVGAEMKGAFGLVHQGRCYISQYLGSMDSYFSQQSFEKVHAHLTSVLGFHPDTLISDQHPGYFGYSWCDHQSTSQTLTWAMYQHHEAHFAAVMGEHELHHSDEPVLGFVWDGTGLSPEQQIWGSETFLWQHGEITHLDNIGCVPHLSGDQMALQPRLSLLAFTDDPELQDQFVKPYFKDKEWTAFAQVKQHTHITTSSMGRLFDAVSCLLTDTHHQSFEGQAAMYLEALALDGKKVWEKTEDHPLWQLDGEASLYQQAMRYVFHSLEKDQEVSLIAFQFHELLVSWIAWQARQSSASKLTFSGGVFQNALLVDLIRDRLADSYELYFHEDLSPNDESIAFGQLVMESIHRDQLNRQEKRTIHEVHS